MVSGAMGRPISCSARTTLRSARVVDRATYASLASSCSNCETGTAPTTKAENELSALTNTKEGTYWIRYVWASVIIFGSREDVLRILMSYRSEYFLTSPSTTGLIWMQDGQVSLVNWYMTGCFGTDPMSLFFHWWLC